MEMPESPQIHTLVHLHVCIPTNRLQAHPFYAISSLEYSLFTSHINPPSLLLGSDELAAINPVFYQILSVDAHIHPYHWFPSRPRRVKRPQGSRLAMLKLLAKLKGHNQHTQDYSSLNHALCLISLLIFFLTFLSLNLVAFIVVRHHSRIELEDCSSSKTCQLKDSRVNDQVTANRLLAAPSCALRQIGP